MKTFLIALCAAFVMTMLMAMFRFIGGDTAVIIYLVLIGLTTATGIFIANRHDKAADQLPRA